MNIVTRLAEFFLKCPSFEKTNPFYTDFNDETSNNYAINTLPSPQPTKDCLGNRYYKFNFAITSRKYTADNLNRIDNLGVVKEIEDWIEEQEDAQDYPNLGANTEVTGLHVTNSGYLYENDPESSNGLYQIQCCIEYTKIKK